MKPEIFVLILFLILFLMSLVGVLPIAWFNVLIAYLATDRAVQVARSFR